MTAENNTDFLYNIGQKLRAVRLKNKLTQKQVSKALNVTQSYLSSVERGKKSACTAFIISLIRYYKVPYDLIFGNYTADYSLTCFPDGSAPTVYMSLLAMLARNANSKELNCAIDGYMKICNYMILRTLLKQNPHCSEKIFSLSDEETQNSAKKLINSTPEQLERFIRHAHINRKAFEIPIEHNGELREYIKLCEELLRNSEK